MIPASAMPSPCSPVCAICFRAMWPRIAPTGAVMPTARPASEHTSEAIAMPLVGRVT
jgi:hypothetical protein